MSRRERRADVSFVFFVAFFAASAELETTQCAMNPRVSLDERAFIDKRRANAARALA